MRNLVIENSGIFFSRPSCDHVFTGHVLLNLLVMFIHLGFFLFAYPKITENLTLLIEGGILCVHTTRNDSDEFKFNIFT